MVHASRQPAQTPQSVGSFNPLVLTRVMRQAARPEHNGALHVVSGPSVKTIRFGRGSVRFASSNIQRDRLGESMLAHSFISRSDFRVASDTMRRQGCRFGEALVSMGRLTENELHRELAIQAQRIVLSLFRIEEGTYRLEPGSEDMPTLPFGLPVTPLLLKGLRSIKDGRLILSELPPAESRLRVSPTPPPGFNMDKLSAAERSVLDFAADGRTIGEIVRGTKVGRVDAFHGCFALLSLGLLERLPEPGDTIEEAEVSVASENENENENETMADSAMGISPSPDELEAALARLEPSPSQGPVSNEAPSTEPPRREPGKKRAGKAPSYNDLIRLQYERLEAVSEAGLLGVRENVSLEELETAYGDLKREWAELRQQTDDQSCLLKLDSIERRLAAAYANMRFRCENPTGARDELQKSLELDPDNEEARKLLGAGGSPSTMKKLLRRMLGSSSS